MRSVRIMRAAIDLRLFQITRQPSMNSSSQPDTTQPSEHIAEQGVVKKNAIKPFSFPFSADVFAPAKQNDKPWHQHGNKSNHDQRPDAAPKGSRRSMGKRLQRFSALLHSLCAIFPGFSWLNRVHLSAEFNVPEG